MERLQKVLAQAGVASRRKCEDLIREGRVQVNGVTVRELGTKVDPQQDEIRVDGRPIRRESYVYLLLYKPTGVITSLRDPAGRPVVTDLLHGVKQRVFPVGRLDYDTSGLLLLTNDGDMANRIAHPSFEIEKVYHAWVKGVPAMKSIRLLAEGVPLEDGMTAPAKARLIREDTAGGRALLELTIHEGRNRQVRRMCSAVGHPVLALKRIRLGFLTLDGLTPGQYRYLTEDEVARLKRELLVPSPRL
ncbi:MAG: rRNA pseudouridine synthase [Brevibacillus sp.]|nr:rRNA pseudouridine synthase [Brevibacillus sp.]